MLHHEKATSFASNASTDISENSHQVPPAFAPTFHHTTTLAPYQNTIGLLASMALALKNFHMTNQNQKETPYASLPTVMQT